LENGQSPGRRRAEAALWRAAKAGGATEKMGLDRCVLSFLTSAAARQLSRSKMIALVIGLWRWIPKNLS